MTKLRITLVALLLPGIAAIGLLIPPPAAEGCAATVAHAITSPHQLVHGSFACLSERQQYEAALAGYDGDAGLQKLAKERGRDQARYVGSTSDGAVIYELSGPDVGPVTVLFYVDASGHVTRIDSDAAL